MDPLRVLVCCPNGAGISLMMEGMVRSAAQRLGLPVGQLHHGSIREGARTAGAFDLVLCPQELADQLRGWQGQVTIIPLRNPLSRRELEERLGAFWQDCLTRAQSADRTEPSQPF